MNRVNKTLLSSPFLRFVCVLCCFVYDHELHVTALCAGSVFVFYYRTEELDASDRVAPLRMGARRATPSSQVLSDFEVMSYP